MPYYEFQYMVRHLSDHLEKERQNQKEQDDKYNNNQSALKYKQPKMPKTSMPKIPGMPKMPKF